MNGGCDSTRYNRTPMPPAQTIVYPANGNLYLNITNRCSCACTFCLRELTWEVYGYDLLLEYEPSVEELTQEIELALVDEPADEIVFCGLGEPTLRLDVVLAVVEWAHIRRLRTRLDTNGLGQLANPGVAVVPALAAAGLRAVSISLNATDPCSYNALCRPVYSKAFRAVVRFARECVAGGIETQLSALRGVGADIDACAALADEIGAQFRARGAALPPGWRTPDSYPGIAASAPPRRPLSRGGEE
jgi:TatD family-associated radical SAM protein